MNAARQPRIPGPDHPITLTPNRERVLVRAGGALIADTREALILQEASYPPVQYIPRKDVDMNLLQRTDHSSYCPFKGDASYYSIPAAARSLSTRYGVTKTRIRLLDRSRTT